MSDKLSQKTLKQIEKYADIKSLIITVTDEESEKLAGLMLTQLRDRKKAIQDEIGPLKQSAHKHWKDMCDFEDKFTAPINKGICELKNRLADYHQAKVIEAAKHKDTQQALIDAIAESGNLELLPTEQKHVNTNIKVEGSRTISYIDDVDVEVTDILQLAKIIISLQIPQYVIKANDSELKTYIKKMKIKQLPGVKINWTKRVR